MWVLGHTEKFNFYGAQIKKVFFLGYTLHIGFLLYVYCKWQKIILYEGEWLKEREVKVGGIIFCFIRNVC